MSSTLLLLPLLLQSAAPEATAPASAIRTVDIQAHIRFLASDEMEGRESGRRGGHLASKYVAAHFARLGLQTLPGQDDYRLPFETSDDDGSEITCYNVVGVIPGTDPEMSKQYIAIGGHHDHAGVGGPGAMGFPDEVHNGADDNASGTAGVLELAEYYAAHPLRHSLIIMTFSAEERGLLGSAHLVKSKTLPVDDIMVMLNCDMIGRANGYLFVGGLGTAEELHPALDSIFEASPMELELDDRGEAPSDNTSFFQAGIPAMFFFTNIHEDYHRPGDDWEKIDYEGEAAVLNLVLEITATLDDMRSLTFVNVRGMGMPSDFMARMMTQYQTIERYKAENRGKLGVRGATVRDGGVAIESVVEGGAAAAVGLKSGDVLMQVGEVRTSDMRALRRSLNQRRRGTDLDLVVMRDGKRLTFTATLQ